MPTPESTNELAALERLRADEVVLDQRIEDARQEAERAVAGARATAEHEREAAAARVAQELAERAAALERQRAEIAAAAGQEADGRREAIVRAARAHLAEAVALVAAAVEGRAP